MKTAKVIKNHYGVIVDSENALTGVYSHNAIAWEWLHDYICLDCESFIDLHENCEYEPCNDCLEYGYALDFMECDSSHVKLLGDWIKDTKTNQYEPDKTGEFAAVERESTVQVVWSKTTQTGLGLCSPCYPGQADMDSSGNFTAYTLPEWAIYES